MYTVPKKKAKNKTKKNKWFSPYVIHNQSLEYPEYPGRFPRFYWYSFTSVLRRSYIVYIVIIFFFFAHRSFLTYDVQIMNYNLL